MEIQEPSPTRVSKIVTDLSRKLSGGNELIFAVTMQDLLQAIAQRLGETALLLSPCDLQLARDEVRAAVEHYLDERELMSIGLDNWEVTRHL